MNEITTKQSRPQGIATEEFFYFFLRMRKNEVKRTVKVLQERYPDDSPEQIAKRLINAKTGLSLLGGGMLYLATVLQNLGPALKLAGIVGSSSMLTRMHLYLILEIGLAFGHDADDSARVPEMLAIVAATGLAAAAPPLLVSRFNLDPRLTVAVGAGGMMTFTRLVGFAAVKYYGRKQSAVAELSPAAA